MLDIFRKIY